MLYSCICSSSNTAHISKVIPTILRPSIRVDWQGVRTYHVYSEDIIKNKTKKKPHNQNNKKKVGPSVSDNIPIDSVPNIVICDFKIKIINTSFYSKNDSARNSV